VASGRLHEHCRRTNRVDDAHVLYAIASCVSASGCLVISW
jgi:hypothetical protein